MGNAEPVFSDTSPMSVDARIDKTGITLGDIITYTIVIHHDADMETNPPDVHIKGFDFVDSGAGKPAFANGQIVQEYWYRFRADETGKRTIDPVPVTFTSPDQKNRNLKIQGQIMTPKVSVEVQSVLRQQGEPTDIRDIKGISPIGGLSDYYHIALLLVILVALVVLAIWIMKSKKSFVISKGIRSPYDRALHELELLNAKRLLELGKVQEHYFELSEIFRRYLGTRYSFPSLDWTTEEINYKLQGMSELNEFLRQQACSILTRSDKVKFAKATINPETSSKIMQSAIQFIQATGKIPENVQSTGTPT